jgi:hypothetical protein
MERFNQFRNRYHAAARGAMAPFLNALSYRPRVRIVPDRQGTAVTAKGSYEGRVSVPAGAVLWGISASSSQAAGFRLNLLDGGATGEALASASPFYSQLSGQGPTQVKDSAGTLKTITNPLFILPKHRVITEPGLIRVQILNLAAAVNTIQVCLHVSLPPRPGDPRNQWNELMDAELNLARRAIRNQDLTTGLPMVPSSQAIALGGDPMSQPATNLPFSTSATGDTVIVPASAGNRIAIHQLSLFSTEEQNIRLLDGTPGGTDLQGGLPDYKGGYFLPYQHEEPHFVLTAGQPFVLNIAAGTVSGLTGTLTGFVKFRLLQKWGN